MRIDIREYFERDMNQHMKITLFIGSLYGGGAERVSCNLANYLVQKGHQVEILTMSETEETYELDKQVIIKTLLPLSKRKNRLWNMVVRFPKFCSYLKTNKNDVYIVMLPKTTIMLLLFRWLTNAKIIAAERADPAAYPPIIAKLLKTCSSKADGFVFQTDEALAWYGKRLRKIRTEVIPNAINPIFIRPYYTGERKKVIAGAGRLNEQKNFVLLIQAFAMLASDFTDYKLIIYGKGEKKKELEDLAVSYGLQDRIVFPGNIRNIAEEMEKNSMFVLSSNYEGMPNALIEAMALGLPCVSTDCPVGGPKYLIKDGINGLLVPIKNKEAIAKAIREILSDPEKAQKMGSEAAKIGNKLNPDKIYGQWETFCLKVVDE